MFADHPHYKVEFENSANPRLFYMVSCIARTGSTLLCDALINTGLAGAPMEFFNPGYMHDYFQMWNVQDRQDYYAKLFHKKTSPNGIWGFKANYLQLRTFQPGEIKSSFPNLRYIFLSRKDKLAQAISELKAEQTQQWHTGVQHLLPQYKLKELQYNFKKIKDIIAYFEFEEKQWETYFLDNQIMPLRITYEDLVASYDETIKKVLRFLEVNLPESFVVQAPKQFKKLADSVSQEWTERYNSENNFMEGVKAPANYDVRLKRLSWGVLKVS
jgi:LPS sulfotransferase NodH